MNLHPDQQRQAYLSKTILLSLAILAALLFAIPSSASADSVVPAFIKVGNKYDFALAVNPAATTKDATGWCWLLEWTVVEVDQKAGWITAKNKSGAVRQINMNTVLFVE